jgi:hypothetical protein
MPHHDAPEILASHPRRLHCLLEFGDDPTWSIPVTRKWREEDIPSLLAMMTDMRLHELPDEHPWSWAPLHALRALVDLCAPEAMSLALALLEPLRILEKEEFRQEVSYLGCAGLEALPAIEAILTDPSIHVDSRSLAVSALGWMAAEVGGPEERPCADVLRRALTSPEGVPAELRSRLQEALSELEDPHRGLDPDCPLCRMLIEGTQAG